MYRMINSGRFTGLEWLDKDKTVFKVPWIHAKKRATTGNGMQHSSESGPYTLASTGKTVTRLCGRSTLGVPEGHHGDQGHAD